MTADLRHRHHGAERDPAAGDSDGVESQPVKQNKRLGSRFAVIEIGHDECATGDDAPLLALKKRSLAGLCRRLEPDGHISSPATRSVFWARSLCNQVQ